MPVNFLGQRKPQSHKENRPVYNVEADNVLAHHVQIGRPVFFESFAAVAVGVVADTRYIIRQSVEPDVNDVFIVEIDGDAPSERRTRHA